MGFIMISTRVIFFIKTRQSDCTFETNQFENINIRTEIDSNFKYSSRKMIN
jgi:hypothetical protein